MKKWIYASLALLLMATVIFECTVRTESLTAWAPGKSQKPIYHVDTTEKKVAISFDAAWGADNTLKLLDILDSYHVGATFFLVGFWIDKYPDMVKEIASRGYEIGNHSKNHPEMSKLSREQMLSEIRYVNDKIRELTGKTPNVFRPPFGDYNDLLVTTLREEGMHAIQWSVDSLDWKEYGRQPLIDRVFKKVSAGDIFLFHNNARYTPDALPEILERLLAEGYTVCSVGDLIYQNGYFVDQQGIQHKILQ